MKIKILPSSVDREPFQFAATYLIDDTIAVDAGSLGFCSLAQQQRVRHVVLSHSHLDHINSLPLFLDNVYSPGPQCPIVYGSASVLECLTKHFFNEKIWPDIARLSREETPFAEFVELQHARPIEIDGIRLTPVELNHVVPCFGFLIESDNAAVVLVSDTGPTGELWALAKGCRRLRAVFLESAFPNSYAWLADKAKHLTPDMLLKEYQKLGRDVPLVAIHIKPAFYDQVVQELQQLGLPALSIGEPNREYEF
jgi:ribonuclease BN (tRNA processing enzyme)